SGTRPVFGLLGIEPEQGEGGAEHGGGAVADHHARLSYRLTAPFALRSVAAGRRPTERRLFRASHRGYGHVVFLGAFAHQIPQRHVAAPRGHFVYAAAPLLSGVRLYGNRWNALRGMRRLHSGTRRTGTLRGLFDRAAPGRQVLLTLRRQH